MKPVIFEHLMTVPVRKRPRTYRVSLFGIVGEGTWVEWAEDFLATLALLVLLGMGMLYWVVAS